ncbi:ATP-dependent zinc metalloprotease FtsH [Piscirickettsia salmonis]|uniref:ATP-dependent zinc metalloprotease FtsH n=1 Tax=Piscirickettsia salmonis TaxID=1238 RepID=UPI003EB89251
MIKNIMLWLVIALVLVTVFSNLGPRQQSVNRLDYSTFVKDINNGQVKSVIIDGLNIKGQTSSGTPFATYIPWKDPFLMDQMLAKNVTIAAKPPEQRSWLLSALISWFPGILLIAIWIFFLRQMQGGGGGKGMMSFGSSKARLLGEDQIKVNFADVAGCEEAKEEVKELVDFLRDPTKFQKLGGKIPQGVLMVGPPGTGKTLLAKAIAGEAKVPFFSISGSDFVEMFVGVGASRVRDMFDQAKKRAPCIIFIDEIDAVGRHRGSGMGGGHDEREQTLNQMLVEMDGFEGTEGVIVIAATNRPDVLDPALLRPGRFDRQVNVGLPDVKGREQILKVHMRKVPLGDDVKASLIARGTPGFSGADLANLVNEAALFAARKDKTVVAMREFDDAKDKILMGTERRSMAMTEEQKRLTAFHEAGHAIVGCLVPDHDPVYKVSIVPRGRALGVTMYLPEEDSYGYSRERLESLISSMYGGRIAEALVFGVEKVTTGASNDIEKASEVARNMVTKWGLSERLGPILYGQEGGDPFGYGAGKGTPEFSDQTSVAIDEEVRQIIDRNYTRAESILIDNRDILDAMADALMVYETIDREQVADLMARRPVKAPKDWDQPSDESGSSASGDELQPLDANINTDINDTKSADQEIDQGAPSPEIKGKPADDPT